MISIEALEIDSDSDAVLDVVRNTFLKCVAPSYSEEGNREFLKFIGKDEFLKRQKNTHFTLVAKEEKRIVGVIEYRKYDHICLFFVIPEMQRRGIGKILMSGLLKKIRSESPEQSSVSVNSSPNAVDGYKVFGFVTTGPLKEINGIKFVPMEMNIQRM